MSSNGRPPARQSIPLRLDATQTGGPITPASSVRDVLRRYPHLEAVFQRHGLTECGGPQGPQEPIALFASVHRVDAQLLVADLNREARRPTPAVASAPRATPAPPVYPIFLKTALAVGLTLGFTMGTAVLLARGLGIARPIGSEQHVQVHGIAQLFGWVGLFIMGVAYHVVPRFQGVAPTGRRLSLLTMALVVAGLVLRSLGQPLEPGPVRAVLLAASGVGLLAGAAAFAWAMARLLARRGIRTDPSRSDPFRPWLWAALFWLVSMAGAALVSLVPLVQGERLVPFGPDQAVLHGLLYGFAGAFVFGVSLRTLPHFLALGPVRPWALRPAFWAFNLGVTLRVADWWAGDGKPGSLALAGAGLEAAAVALFLVGLPVLGRSGPMGRAGYRAFPWYIRAAYAWLAVAVALELALAAYWVLADRYPGYLEISAARHAFALGFLTLIIFGMAGRIVPVFRGVALRHARLMDAVLPVLVVSTALRVTLSLALPATPAARAALATSGLLTFAAFAAFATVLWTTLRAGPQPSVQPLALRTRPRRADGPPPLADMTVAQVLERYPNALEVFLQHGFTPLADPESRRTMASQVTVAQACAMRQVDLKALLADLEAVARQTGGPATASRAPARGRDTTLNGGTA